MANPQQTWIHGVCVNILPEWEDRSVYRFALPNSRAELQTSLHAGATKTPFTSNIVAARMPRDPEQTSDCFFEEGNRQATRDPSYRVLQAGHGTRGGRPACWQDVTFFSPEAQLQIFQRQVAILFEGYAVVFNITSDCNDLAPTAAAVGLLLDA